MRLIDVDMMNEDLFYEQVGGKDSLIKAECAFNMIMAQPTAYDIDKVVEELEHKKEEVQRMRNTCVALSDLEVCDIENVSYERAIEIVKQGGVADDLCEWKFEETNGIAWHCDEKCTTYNQVYIKDLKIVLEDFECRCPYCGKKIKVMER